jgi:hypothetical protein
LDAAENETLLFKTQLREGNVLASTAEARTGRPPQKTGGSVRWCYPGACHIGIRSLLETGALDEPLFSRGNADFSLGKTLGFQEN